jgi:DNA-binding PadR family transcriptional regulator
MATKRLTPGSYAVLALLSIGSWSTYELTKLFGRSVQFVMPRTEASRYLEPKRLVDAGLATARVATVGRRRRTVYSITPAGEAALHDWLASPPRPTQLESEALLKILFGNMVPRTTLLEQLRAVEAEAEAIEVPWRSIAREYADGDGPFPERVHINMLFWALLDRWARLRADWARWAAAEVESWPDQNGPRDRTAVRDMLRGMLDDAGSSFPARPSVTTR